MSEQGLENADLCELLLKHLARDPDTMTEAKNLGLKAEDFLASSQYGVRIYSVIASVIISIGSAPIDSRLLIAEVDSKFTNGELEEVHRDSVYRLLVWMYDEPTTPNYFREQLRGFIKNRREEKAKVEAGDNDDLRSRLNQIAVDLTEHNIASKVQVVSPFEDLIVPNTSVLTKTGFAKVDAILGGLGLGEYGLIIGFTGSGKTATCVGMTMANALMGVNVAYVPMEDTLDMVAQRFYSKRYHLDYSYLRKGEGTPELRQLWRQDQESGDNALELLKKHIRIISLKEVTPVRVEVIKERLDKEYEKDGFIPRVVILDQMSFLTPNQPIQKSAQTWDIQSTLSKECDELSHSRIGGDMFALWVMHQAKGKVKLDITREEIQGFKGIDQPTDTTLYIGRDGPMSNDFVFGSLKSRHSANFRVAMKGDLKYMTFLDVTDEIAPTENQLGNMAFDQPKKSNPMASVGLMPRR